MKEAVAILIAQEERDGGCEQVVGDARIRDEWPLYTNTTRCVCLALKYGARPTKYAPNTHRYKYFYLI